MGGASWATLASTTLKVGQHANHKVSCHGEGVLISASPSTLGSDWRLGLGSETWKPRLGRDDDLRPWRLDVLNVRLAVGVGQEFQAQAVSERALVPWSAYVFGVQPR